MSGCGCEVSTADQSQRRVLWQLLVINAVMFVVELGVGVMAESTGLIADALDMLADATVYGIGVYAVGRSALAKISAARLSGIFQLLLAAGVALDVGRRMIAGSDPASLLMMGVGAIALLANVVCLVLIARHRAGEVHMRASWIFSRNDVIANVGVIVAGLLVYLLASPWPDLVVGIGITLLVMRGGWLIVQDARRERELLADMAG